MDMQTCMQYVLTVRIQIQPARAKTHHDEALEQIQGLVYGGLPIKLMAGQLLIGHSLQALSERGVLQNQGVFLLLNGGVVMLQLFLLLLQLLQLPV